jgi:hypothetical protein
MLLLSHRTASPSGALARALGKGWRVSKAAATKVCEYPYSFGSLKTPPHLRGILAMRSKSLISTIQYSIVQGILRPLRAADGRDYSMQRRDRPYLSAAIDEGGLLGAATNVR